MQEIKSAELLVADTKAYDTVSYITDIHLCHLYDSWKCKTESDKERITDLVVNQISANDPEGKIKLIAGDVTSDYDYYCAFISKLTKDANNADYFFTLGNHELWPFEGEELEHIVERYKELLSKNGMKLVHNNLFYYDEDNSLNEIPTSELLSINEIELEGRLHSARLVIFGGLGFSGRNRKMNANQGVYRSTILREQEIEESLIIEKLYYKVTNALFDKKVIILTHMPLKDWSCNNIPIKGFVYVNGHNHNNYYHDDGLTRVYSDNQIGYKQKNVSMKHLSIAMDYDVFSRYPDGIYIISRNDYIKFYQSIKESIQFRREYKYLYMLKREDVYMFFMENSNGIRYILNGGAIKKEKDHSLEYFYEHLVLYSQSIRLYLSKFNRFQESISEEVKKIGGSGYVHGCIVDIDFYNHLYLNPIDGSVTPYYADNMINKYVYKNIPSLLKYECPELYLSFKKVLSNKSTNQLILANNDITLSDKRTFVDSTEMYRVSRIVKGLQYATKYNVIRLWSDSIAEGPSEESGKMLITKIINSGKKEDLNEEEKTVARLVTRMKRAKLRVDRRRKNDPIWQKKETEYRTEVARLTQTIDVLQYRGTVDLSEYHCKLCGHKWKQSFAKFDCNPICPICKK